jgi:hypothetical protein
MIIYGKVKARRSIDTEKNKDVWLYHNSTNGLGSEIGE